MYNNKRKIISLILFISVIVTFVTGVLLHPFADVPALKIAHAGFSVLLVITCLIHMIQYKRSPRARKN